MLELYFLCFVLAVVAFTWVNYLVSSGDILSFIPQLYWRIVNPDNTVAENVGKVLFQCEKCLSGQLALWLYLFLVVKGRDYCVSEHFLFTIFTIFVTGWMSTIHESL